MILLFVKIGKEHTKKRRGKKKREQTSMMTEFRWILLLIIIPSHNNMVKLNLNPELIHSISNKLASLPSRPIIGPPKHLYDPNRQKKSAAVCVALCHCGEEAAVLLTKRTHNVGSHQGQVNDERKNLNLFLILKIFLFLYRLPLILLI